jgi:regulator of replication initiation timing
MTESDRIDKQISEMYRQMAVIQTDISTVIEAFSILQRQLTQLREWIKEKDVVTQITDTDTHV